MLEVLAYFLFSNNISSEVKINFKALYKETMNNMLPINKPITPNINTNQDIQNPISDVVRENDAMSIQNAEMNNIIIDVLSLFNIVVEFCTLNFSLILNPPYH